MTRGGCSLGVADVPVVHHEPVVRLHVLDHAVHRRPPGAEAQEISVPRVVELELDVVQGSGGGYRNLVGVVRLPLERVVKFAVTQIGHR